MAKTSLTIDTATRDALLASLSSLAEVAERFLEAGRSLVDLPLRLIDPAEFHFRDLAALRASDTGLRFEPGDGFLKLVAAVQAIEIGGHVINVEQRHGWPILSVGDRTPTVSAAFG
jgi:hypothetical protein